MLPDAKFGSFGPTKTEPRIDETGHLVVLSLNFAIASSQLSSAH